MKIKTYPSISVALLGLLLLLGLGTCGFNPPAHAGGGLPQATETFQKLGDVESTTLATATTQKVFNSLATHVAVGGSARRVVNIQNHDAAEDIYVSVVTRGASAPTISSTAHGWLISAKQNKIIPVGRGLDVYLRHSGAGTINFTAMELFAQ